MAVTLNKANLVLKDANGNIGKIEQLSSNDLAKIKTAVSDVALVVNQSNHTPIEATTTNKGVVQLATSVDVASGAIDKVVTAEQLHNATTGTSALATENLARIDAVVTEAGISVDHTNTNQLKTAVTTLISNATPATATASTVGVVKPDNDTITIDSNGVLTATKATQDSAGQQINTTYVKDVTASNATITVTKGNGTTLTATINNVANATNATKASQDKNGAQIDTTYFKSANGTFTGQEYFRDVNNSVLRFNGGNTHDSGASLMLYGKDADLSHGGFDLVACTKEDSSDAKQLIGTPAGLLTWNNKNIVRSVNGVNADENGNVTTRISTTGINVDYSAGVTLSNGSKAPSDGLVVMTVHDSASSGGNVTINNITVAAAANIRSGVIMPTAIINKDDTITLHQSSATLYPFK